MSETNKASPRRNEVTTDHGRIVMCRDWFKTSEYPADFVPKGGEVFLGIDYAKDGSGCTVKGFYKDGEYHVQSVEYMGT